jgi:hypothetical protein
MKAVEQVRFCPVALAAWPHSRKERYEAFGQWPEKGVDMPAADWEAIREESNATGRPITVNSKGLPCLGKIEPVKLTKEQVDINRRAAYADPLTGSDAYFIEYQRKQADGDLEGAEIAKKNWLSRSEEIKQGNPYP